MSSSLFTSSIMYETCYLMDRAQQIGYFSYKARLRRDINDDWAGLNHDIWVSSLLFPSSNSEYRDHVRHRSTYCVVLKKTTCFLCEVGEFWGGVELFFPPAGFPPARAQCCPLGTAVTTPSTIPRF